MLLKKEKGSPPRHKVRSNHKKKRDFTAEGAEENMTGIPFSTLHPPLSTGF
jgi:hypothetical protein